MCYQNASRVKHCCAVSKCFTFYFNYFVLLESRWKKERTWLADRCWSTDQVLYLCRAKCSDDEPAADMHQPGHVLALYTVLALFSSRVRWTRSLPHGYRQLWTSSDTTLIAYFFFVRMGENQEEANKRLPPSPWTKKEKPRRRNELLGWKTKKRRKSFSLCAYPILSIGIAHEWWRLYFTTGHNGRNCTRLALPSKNYYKYFRVLFAFYWKASCPVAWRRIPSSGSILFSLWFRGERGERSRRKLRTQRTSCL